MQIVAEDVQKRADSCKSYMGIFSLFFTMDDDQDESAFWSWVGQDTITNFNLNDVFPITAPVSTKTYGYIGSDSMPNCTASVCWYLAMPNEGTNYIKSATLAKL